jgi:hypothetical protein
MVSLSPIVRLDDRDTFNVFRVTPVDLVVVRFQDLVSKKTFKLNKTYSDVISSGGLHGFLDFHGNILLSLIMKDELIANMGPEKYAAVINAIRPDSFTTIDGETYDGESAISLREIQRIHAENKELVPLCSSCRPIGLVKGCTKKQVEYHMELLKSLGIEDFVFHVGDFFRKGDPGMIAKARVLSFMVRQQATSLILYGMGSQKRLQHFSYADTYVTFTHFVTAMKGRKFVGTDRVKYYGSYHPQIVVDNFIQIYQNVESLKSQTKLV